MQTINSAFRLYYEAAVELQQLNKEEIKKVEVPIGVAIAPNNMVSAPREFAERLFNIRQWTIMPKGKHFTAMEQPELFAEDIRKFVKSISTGKQTANKSKSITI